MAKNICSQCGRVFGNFEEIFSSHTTKDGKLLCKYCTAKLPHCCWCIHREDIVRSSYSGRMIHKCAKGHSIGGNPIIVEDCKDYISKYK